MTNTALIGLGANLPWQGRGPEENLRRAAAAAGRLGTGARLSRFYLSPAWPDPSAPEYVNAVLAIKTALAPEALLAALQAIEAAFGRVRSSDPARRYAPRSMDLDLLALGEEVRESETLALPHPRIAERDFVLLPLADIAPAWRHPVTGAGTEALIAALPKVTARPL
jgi:2-amino-4-hydroxy-6-hydroxymethyldihydropteridine diphosphokinase